ncbi:uncharacterized protein LOC126736545 [Anthonomus grandis grandis]|uniref:uncharacterized protein LOC126736545 n=1 Tax=Anthonomus grandis grandis TaxID=2921223 RepID=UPI002166B86E|nr:uncharacterized protein LOC126736545 [Anthonomus grandis grandis]XP_050296906.1 uncharacterized protein LOC126736545 [Anthonomus grandis grandis]
MKTILQHIIVVLYLIVRCHTLPTNQTTLSIKNGIVTATTSSILRENPILKPEALSSTTNKPDTRSEIGDATTKEDDTSLSAKDAVVIDLEKIQKMSIVEYIGRKLRSLWDYIVYGSESEPETTFVGRCIGIAKKIRQIMPLFMIGAGIIITKLGFLVLFSLKTIGLVGLLLLLNVGTVAAKLGAFLASKKSHEPQNLHLHVQPWKSDDHIYSSGHYGWEDKSDTSIQTHELYNLYEKLKFEQSLKRYLSANNRYR